MQINHASLHIFDFTASLAVYSEHELKIGDQPIQDYLASHVSKAFKDPACRTGALNPGGMVAKWIQAYKGGSLSFVELSKHMGERTFDYMKQATEGCIIDTIVCEAVTDRSYLCLLQCQAHDAYTHQLFSEDDGSLATELVPHKAVLPTATQKLRAYLAIDMGDYSIKLFEPKGQYDGEVTYILADRVLQIGTQQSTRDTIRKVQKIVDKVAEAHESDGVEALAKTKSFIAKNAEVSDTLDPIRIVEEVFTNSIQVEAAKKELEEEHMLAPLPVNRDFATKVGQMHKIKTDTGIEISFPVEYMKKRDFIEIVTNDDGSLRIEVKNINKIINK